MTNEEEKMPEPVGKPALVLVVAILLAAMIGVIALGKMGMISAAPESTTSE